jgi:hypothetical protein
MSRYFTSQSNLLQEPKSGPSCRGWEPLCFNAGGVDLEQSSIDAQIQKFQMLQTRTSTVKVPYVDDTAN